MKESLYTDLRMPMWILESSTRRLELYGRP